jgi:type II secretory pathway pseudopilin PulG
MIMKSFVNKKGFTFAEIMISVGILACILLTILGIFSAAVSGIKRGENQVVAATLAQQVMETYKNDLELNFDAYGLATSNVALDPNTVNGVPFSAQLVVSQASPYSSSRIKRLDVTIGWKEHSGGERKFSISTYVNKVQDN